MSHSVLIFDGIKDMIHGDFKWSEVNFLSTGLGRIPRRPVHCFNAMTLILFRGNRLWFFLPFIPLLGSAISCTSDSILDLYIPLSQREDVPHLGYFILHQLLVEKVSDLQPIDECSSNFVIIAIIYQVHLALEISDVVLEALFWLHLDHEEVIDIFSTLVEAYW